MDFKRTFHICKIEQAVDQIIQKYEIDVIHTHFFHPSGENVVFAAKKFNLPLVATVRGAEVCDYPELNYGSLRSRYYKTMLIRTIKKIDRITCPNKKIVSDVHTILGADNNRIEYLPNGIETNVIQDGLSRRPGFCTGDKVKFMAIGRLVKLKNHILILKALELLSDDDIELTIVGIGDEYELLNQYIQKHQLQNVSIIDEMPKKDLFELLLKNNALIHPSLTEGMPNVVIESFALGVPVLASKIPAHQDLIEEGENGFLFDPLAPKELAQLIRRFRNGQVDEEQLSQNCKQTAGHYSLDRKVKRYSEIYQTELLKKQANAENGKNEANTSF